MLNLSLSHSSYFCLHISFFLCYFLRIFYLFLLRLSFFLFAYFHFLVVAVVVVYFISFFFFRFLITFPYSFLYFSLHCFSLSRIHLSFLPFLILSFFNSPSLHSCFFSFAFACYLSPFLPVIPSIPTSLLLSPFLHSSPPLSFLSLISLPISFLPFCLTISIPLFPFSRFSSFLLFSLYLYLLYSPFP